MQLFDRVVGNFTIFLQPFPTYLNFRIFEILNYKYPERLIHNFSNLLIPRAEPVSAFPPRKAALLISIEHLRRSARIFRVRKIFKFPLTERSGPTIYRNSKRSHFAYLRVNFCSLCHFRMKISLPRMIRGNISKVTAHISNWRRNSPTMERTALELQSFKNRWTRVPRWTLDCVTQSRNQRTKRHANDLLATDSRRFTKYSPDTRDSIALANVPAN